MEVAVKNAESQPSQASASSNVETSGEHDEDKDHLVVATAAANPANNISETTTSPDETAAVASSHSSSNDMDDAPPPSDIAANPPPPRFVKGQRVWAKDVTSGLLYEAVVRRTMYGAARQRQLHMTASMSDAEVEEFFQQEPEPTWHCFVHYLGWNVKWDRFVEESSLYEPSEGTKQLAKRLQEEVRAVKANHRGKSAAAGAKIWVELDQRMRRLERERRMEERREELAKQGIVMEEMEGEEEEEIKPKSKKKQWTKATLTKELSLREKCLQGPRKQVLAEKLALPFSLNKIMVDEWEIITQCDMLPNIPASFTVRQALGKYLEAKTTVMAKLQQKNDEPTESSSGADAGTKPASKTDAVSKNDTDETSKKKQEWKDMVDGTIMLFDQSFARFLLYRQELPQYQSLLEDEELSKLRPSEVYGCEHFLRFLIHLPPLLASYLSDVEARPIYSKLKDLVLFLQKHQGSLFAQSYHPGSKEEEWSGRTTKKRRALSSGTTSENKRKRESNADATTSQPYAIDSSTAVAETAESSSET